MKIISVTFNRNGSSPAQSFICVHFTYEADYPKETFIATWISKRDNDGLNVDNDTIRVTNISRPESCYRGDYFSSKLPTAIKEYCEGLGLTEISINAACFPNQFNKEKIKANPTH